jgi:hypothetical protein
VKNVVYAPHAYDSNAESGNGFDPSARAAFLSKFQTLKSEADELGCALWIGEYGGPSGAAGIENYVDAAYDGAGAVSAGSAYWSYDRDDGYGLLDPDGDEKPNVLAEVVRPYPERVAGSPVSWELDETLQRFTLRYEPDTAIEAPTVIRVPPRFYPNGYRVVCDGCTSTMAGDSLLVTAPPADRPASVTLEPE